MVNKCEYISYIFFVKMSPKRLSPKWFVAQTSVHLRDEILRMRWITLCYFFRLWPNSPSDLLYHALLRPKLGYLDQVIVPIKCRSAMLEFADAVKFHVTF